MPDAGASGLSRIEIDADVLVIGGGMAAAWAAIGAARDGASVVLVDKGYVGTSGVTATAGPGHWFVAPADRPRAIAERQAIAFGLGDPDWMARILEQTWRELPALERHYRFGVNEQGVKLYGAVRGPEYMRALRAVALEHLRQNHLSLQELVRAGIERNLLRVRPLDPRDEPLFHNANLPDDWPA